MFWKTKPLLIELFGNDFCEFTEETNLDNSILMGHIGKKSKVNKEIGKLKKFLMIVNCNDDKNTANLLSLFLPLLLYIKHILLPFRKCYDFPANIFLFSINSILRKINWLRAQLGYRTHDN